MRIDEVAHWSGLVPFAVLVALLAVKREVPVAYWWVAGGLGVSVLGDQMQMALGGTFDHTFYYVPVQIGLVLCAFRDDVLDKIQVFVLCLIGGYVSIQTEPGPSERLVTIVGGSTIVALAWKKNILRGPLLAYFGLGTLAYLWAIQMIGSEAILPRWYAYQGCRWLAFALFAWSAIRYKERAAWTW